MTPAADIDDRIEKCQRILESDPNSQIFAALAEALRRKGDLDKAFRVCQNGLRIHPKYGSAHVVMAKINLDRRLYDWAEAEVKKALELEGKNRTTELLLAEIYIYKGEFQDAVKLLRKLHLADPNNEQIMRLLEIAQKLPREQAELLEKKPSPATPATRGSAPEQVSGGDAAAPVLRPAVSAGLTAGEVVGRAVSLPDVDGALLINFEGLVIEAEWAAGLDASTCAASMAEISKLLDQELVRASFGKVQNLLIETAGAVFYVVRTDDGLFLFVGNERVNLGTLRLKVASLVDKYHPSL